MAFTNSEINEIIELITQHNAHTQYIGARYVPIFGRVGENTIEWDNNAPYEPLTIVLHEGNSFTSRQYVPVGVDILNEDFWANTGNYNAQIEQYRQEVMQYDQRIKDNAENIADEIADRIAADNAINSEIIGINDNISDIEEIIQDKILFIGDSWMTEYPAGVTMWYQMVAERLHLEPYVYGSGGAGFVKTGSGQNTMLTLTQSAIRDIADKSSIKYVVLVAGINDYHELTVEPTAVQTAAATVLNTIRSNFPASQLIFAPMNYSYEVFDDRAYQIYFRLAQIATTTGSVLIKRIYKWLKFYTRTYCFPDGDMHMNQQGNQIFASNFLSTLSGTDNGQRVYALNYSPNNDIIDNTDIVTYNSFVKDSEINYKARIKIKEGVTIPRGNTNIGYLYNSNIGLPFDITDIILTDSFIGTPKFMQGTIYINIVKLGTGTYNNQGQLNMILVNDSEFVAGANTYIYIECNKDCSLT